jgi:aerobic-type carbon monoxide dehydrogenase small subunit (CoxS/CutS family)
MPKYTLTINQKKHTVNVDADTPLLWILRDNLNLTGTKYGCGEGICGACVVHIDGKAERSCILNVEEVINSSITTIEGLAENTKHPIFQTWIELEVMQCGYCQPGQIMTLAAILEKNPNTTRKEIDDAMNEVLCRCGTYQRIRKAVDKLIKEEQR